MKKIKKIRCSVTVFLLFISQQLLAPIIMDNHAQTVNANAATIKAHNFKALQLIPTPNNFTPAIFTPICKTVPMLFINTADGTT
jgi:hypothetical protein